LQQCVEDPSLEKVHIFTDGSANPVGTWPRVAGVSAWAAVFVAEFSNCSFKFIGSIAQQVCLDTESPSWMGATRHSNNTAEISAIAAAIVWSLQAGLPCGVDIHSDSEHAIGITSMTQVATSNVQLAHFARKLYKQASRQFEIRLCMSELMLVIRGMS